MADTTAAQRLYDFAFQRFQNEVKTLQDHRTRFESPKGGKQSLSSRLNRWSMIGQLPIQTKPTQRMRGAYGNLKFARDGYLAAMDARLRRARADQEMARQAQETAEWIRLETQTTEDWRRRHSSLLYGIHRSECQVGAMDIQIAYLRSQLTYLMNEKQRAAELYELVKSFPHKTFFNPFETTPQDDQNIEDALQHKIEIGEQLATVRTALWEEIDKRKDCLDLQTYIGEVQGFLKWEIQETQLSATQGEMTERAVREAKAHHILSTFMYEQAVAAHDRAVRLLADINIIRSIETDLAPPLARDPGSVTVASNYLELMKGRARQAERDMHMRKGNVDITATALQDALQFAAAEANSKRGSSYTPRGDSSYHPRGGSSYPPREGSPYPPRGGSSYQPRGGSSYKPRVAPGMSYRANKPPKQLTSWEWLGSIDLLLSDYASIHTFPEPPSVLCVRQSCKSQQHSRALRVCDCAIRAAFSKAKDLKKERTRWHPDKWSCCREDKKEVFEKKAAEMFMVVDAMYKEGKAK